MSTVSTKSIAKKDLGGPVRVVLSALGVFILSQIVAAMIAELLLALTHPGQPVSGLFDETIWAQFLFVSLAEGLAVLSVWQLLKRRRLNLGFIGLGRKPMWRDLRQGLLGFGVFYALLIIASMLISALFPHLNTNQSQNLGFDHLSGTVDGVLAFLSLVILPPIGEEPLVRGYLYSGLRSRISFWPAMLVTSFLFGMAHLEFGSGTPLVWGAGIETFILSMVLVGLRENTGALYAGALVHLLNNAVAFGVHFHL